MVGPARAQLQKTGATWIATTDYRTYAMLRWFFRSDPVPVVQINERSRFEGFRDPGMNAIRGHAGLYVGREPDNLSPVWAATTAVRQPLERVDAKLARHRDGYLRAGKADRLDPGAFTAAGFTALSRAHPGGRNRSR